MEVTPGRGIPQVPLGADRRAVSAALGDRTVRSARSDHHDLGPAVVVHYDDGRAEMFELAYSGTPGHEVTLDGIQLTYRPMAEVVADLAAAGHHGVESDDAVDYPEGFSIWSMGSLMVEDLGLSGSDVDPDDEVIEGVSVAAAGYFDAM